MSEQSTILKAGVMGWPVDHSLSPRVHGYWLNYYSILGEYVRIPVEPKDFEAKLRNLQQDGFAGCNITVPHKEAALAAVDEADELARTIGAVNTVKVREDGSLFGFNTDGFGFMENLKATPGGCDVKAGPALVLGAGGAARAIVAALLQAGAPEVRIVNRTMERAQALADDLGELGTITCTGWDRAPAAMEDAALLVNTTTLGMKGQAPLVLDLHPLPERAVVNDIVYVPLETELLRAARLRGNRTQDGLGMLLHQARPGFQAWFGRMPEVTLDLRAHVLAGLEDR